MRGPPACRPLATLEPFPGDDAQPTAAHAETGTKPPPPPPPPY